MGMFGGMLDGPDLSAYAGLLNPDALKALQVQAANRQRMALASSLLQAGGPSRTPTNIGQAFGAAMDAGRGASDQFIGQQMPAAISIEQMRQQQEAKKAEADKQQQIAGQVAGLLPPELRGLAMMDPALAMKFKPEQAPSVYRPITPEERKSFNIPDTVPAQIDERTHKVDIMGTGNNTFDPQTVERRAKMISNYQMAPLGAFAQRSAYGQAVMDRVSQMNPQYDETNWQAKGKAVKDFTSGKNGNAVRSFNVALSHLDTLSGLIDAMGNGDIAAINRASNFYKQQTGSAAPASFEAAKKIITDEIVKAIIGSGGGVGDREAAANTISAANSPEQLRAVIQTYKDLMVGQLGGRQQQYEQATGLDDFSRFLSPEAQKVYARAHPSAAPQSSPDIDALLKKYPGK